MPGVLPPSSTETLDARRTISEPVERQGELYCPNCGYDLRALEGEVCPECGVRVDRATLARSRIPWAHRARVGRVRAYLRTAWLVTSEPRVLWEELARPVDFAAAQRFRFVTVALASMPIALPLLLLLWSVTSPAAPGALPPLGAMALGGAAPTPGMWDLALPWVAGALLPPVLPLAIVLLFVLVSGVQSYWFHPRSIPVVRQNRAVALSYYAMAPFAWLPVPVLAHAAVLGVVAIGESTLSRSAQQDLFTIAVILGIVCWGAIAGIILRCWWSLVRLAHRATDGDATRAIFAAVGVPLAWVGCAFVALFAWPWAVGFVNLVIDSLRP